MRLQSDARSSQVLENYHASKLFDICGNPETDVLQYIPDSQYGELRKMVIEYILSTDVTRHRLLADETERAFSPSEGREWTLHAAPSCVFDVSESLLMRCWWVQGARLQYRSAASCCACLSCAATSRARSATSSSTCSGLACSRKSFDSRFVFVVVIFYWSCYAMRQPQ